MPPKAAYLELETEPDLDFEFFLADRLKMTVEELRNSMSQDEFMRWQVWHGRRAQKQELEMMKAKAKGR